LPTYKLILVADCELQTTLTSAALKFTATLAGDALEKRI
jgi:hypothetical protein